jgi:1,2-dihydroxy-3-keto-5-methylthiopentene dioxygenase
MSNLKIFKDSEPQNPIVNTDDAEKIAAELNKIGVRFERWQARVEVSDNATQEEIYEAYGPEINKLMKENGYQSFDVINMHAAHPDKDALRNKFNKEHIHSEDEVRFFVKGRGLFTLHVEDKVYEITCVKNDLISVPTGTPHWFDMGDSPSFTCIRLFDSPDGWVANYTGSEIASQFSTL